MDTLNYTSYDSMIISKMSSVDKILQKNASFLEYPAIRGEDYKSSKIDLIYLHYYVFICQ